MSNTNAIRIENLEKSYREGFLLRPSKVLHGISFVVPKGEIFGFLGANGAGKTTTIKILLAMQSPDAGRVELIGRDPREAPTREKIGYLPERPYFHLNFTGDEFLDFHRGLFPRPVSGPARPSNTELLALVGLPGAGKHALRGFSKGMLQRIGLAQSLVNDPELLILDEPMSGLDPVGRKEVRDLIHSLGQRGKTIFFSSHILSDIEALCTQIAFLEKGRLKHCGPVADLMGSRALEYELLFRGNADLTESLAGLGRLARMSGHSRLTLKSQAQARGAAELCWKLGGEVISFHPVQKSLEEVLFGGSS